jgi:hypothetical protein
MLICACGLLSDPARIPARFKTCLKGFTAKVEAERKLESILLNNYFYIENINFTK